MSQQRAGPFSRFLYQHLFGKIASQKFILLITRRFYNRGQPLSIIIAHDQWFPTFLHRGTGKDFQKMFTERQQKIVVNRTGISNLFVNYSCRCVTKCKIVAQAMYLRRKNKTAIKSNQTTKCQSIYIQNQRQWEICITKLFKSQTPFMTKQS